MSLRSIVLCVIALCGLAGCSSTSDAPAFSSVQTSGIPASVPAPMAVAHVLSALQKGYQNENWSQVRDQFTDARVASPLLDRLRELRREYVLGLKLSLVYVKRFSSAQYIGTLQLAADDRAPSEYAIVVFTVRRGRALIGQVITGLTVRGNTPNWVVTRTAHFAVYHSPYQLVGTDRRYLADIEQERANFARKFGVTLPAVFAIYLYPSTEAMGRLSGGSCGLQPGEVGCTRPFVTPPTIQTVMRAIFHEPIHVYELSLEPPVRPGDREIYIAPLFIREGTAVALENRYADPRLSDYCSDLSYAPLDECARLAASHVRPLRLLSDVGFDSAPPDYAYSLSGSFVKYLILHHGYHAFGRFYYALAAQPKDRESDYDVAARETYQQPIRRLLDDWTAELCAKGC